jgi:UDP-glucuronate 4-epimerase
MKKTILVTGGAGFIGSHLIDELLLDPQNDIICIDNFDTFYAVAQKKLNIANHFEHANYRFLEVDITDKVSLHESLMDVANIDMVVHIAAKAGVRPSIQNPYAYQITNIVGTQNIMDIAVEKNTKQFVFASSSSVYGINPEYPWSEKNNVLMPISPYASSKVGGELMGYTFSHLYKIRFIALRFFTVFGPRQRPDLAIHQFCKKIQNNEPINVYGDGSTLRDYTYVGDIVKGIMAAMAYDQSIYEIINIGNNRPVKLSELIEVIEKVLDKKATINRLPEQPGDVPVTFANIEKAKSLLHYEPATSLEEGIDKFYQWMLTPHYFKS